MKMFQQTSLEAFRGITPCLGRRQREVYDTLKSIGPADNLTLSRALRLPINSVTPRVLELRELGLIGLEGVRVGVLGRKVNFWRAK